MLNNKDTLSYLQSLNLSRDEATLYLELLRKPNSHLELSRITGINRSKVYRIADQLEKRSLLSTQTDDSGTLLAAADPSTLEVEIVTREEAVRNQRAIFQQLLPSLEVTKSLAERPANFQIQTYDGVEGFKQMLWHELKAKDEMVIFGQGTIEDMVASKRWADKLRAKTVEAGYTIREILNPNGDKPVFTLKQEYMNRYSERFITTEVLLLQNQITIYNDTVANYCWRDGQKVGVEIVNHAYATMMRQIFEHYWQIAR